MKKSLLALALFAAMGSAFAGDAVSVDLQKQTVDNNSAPDQYQVSFAYKHTFDNGFALDGGVSAAQNSDNNVATGSSKIYKDTSRAEVGASYQRAVVGPVDLYGRVALGMKAPNGVQAFGYNSEEIGTVIHAPYGFDAKVGYRWRQANNTNVAAGETDTNQTLRMAIAYNINKDNVIALNRDNVHANSDNGGNQTAYHVTYTRKF
jgi:hypothetical protein